MDQEDRDLFYKKMRHEIRTLLWVEVSAEIEKSFLEKGRKEYRKAIPVLFGIAMDVMRNESTRIDFQRETEEMAKERERHAHTAKEIATERHTHARRHRERGREERGERRKRRRRGRRERGRREREKQTCIF